MASYRMGVVWRDHLWRWALYRNGELLMLSREGFVERESAVAAANEEASEIRLAIYDG